MEINPYTQQITCLDDLKNISEWAESSLQIMREHMVMDSGHDEGHFLRVVRNALWFGEGGNVDVIVIASLLHDLVNVPKDSPDRCNASYLSADKALNELSTRYAIPLDLGGKIHHAIFAHSFSANIEPKTLEAKAVQDADRLDSLGPLGIARLFAVSGSMGRTLFHPTDPLAENRELDEIKYGLDHFAIKLGKLYRTMNTGRGMTLAWDLTHQMHNFIISLIMQIEDLDYELSYRRTRERVYKFVRHSNNNLTSVGE